MHKATYSLWLACPCLLGFLVRSMGPAEAAVLLELQFLRRVFLVLGGGIVSLLALGAGKGDDVSHCFFPLDDMEGRFMNRPCGFIR